jgi:hypothetical protein
MVRGIRQLMCIMNKIALETEPVRIQNNTIQNNHDFAISAQHFGGVYENSNILNTVENKKRNRVERMQILIK